MSFIAQYFGECAAGDEVVPGDEIQTYMGGYWHVECAREDAHIPPPEVVCPGCFLIKPCECDDRAKELIEKMFPNG